MCVDQVTLGSDGYRRGDQRVLQGTGRSLSAWVWARILVQVTINRRLQIRRDGHLDQSEGYDLS